MRLTLVTLTAVAAVGISAMVPDTASAQRWGRGWRGGGWGPGIAGFAAGAVIGGALAAPRYGYYGGGYGYGPYDGYYDGGPVAVAPGYGGGPSYVEGGPGYAAGPGGGGDVNYCMQRYRSYDPQSGTFLGYDGARHPCP